MEVNSRSAETSVENNAVPRVSNSDSSVFIYVTSYIIFNFSFNLISNWIHNDSSNLSPVAFQVVHNPECLVTSEILYGI
jgi:hypothetical protein